MGRLGARGQTKWSRRCPLVVRFGLAKGNIAPCSPCSSTITPVAPIATVAPVATVAPAVPVAPVVLIAPIVNPYSVSLWLQFCCNFLAF